MLYFAYGANLNLRGMKRRCPKAVPVSVATLKGYKLVFRRYIDIAPDAKSEVRGAVYELTAGCERALDAFEGDDYRKITVTVETDAGPREAMAYIMNGGAVAPPDIAYYGDVAQGYRDWKLDEAVLRKARYATLHPQKPAAAPSPAVVPREGGAGRR